MKRLIPLLLLFFSYYSAMAQDRIRVPLKNELRLWRSDYMPLPLYELNSTGKFSHIGYVVEDGKRVAVEKEFTIRGLDGLSNELAFNFEFFTGWEEAAIPRNALLVVENYKSDAPRLYVDYNHNLDISDDGPPVDFVKGGSKIDTKSGHLSTLIDLPRFDNPEAHFTYKVAPRLDKIQGIPSKFLSIAGEHPGFKNNQLVDKQYWFGSKRQNIHSASLEINGQMVQLGIIDENCNGLFNDPSDRLLIGEYGSEFLSRNEKDGAVQIGKEALVSINGQVYELVITDATGKYIDLKSSDKEMPYMLKEGDILADATFKMLDGTAKSIYDFLEKGKLTLIDVWGSWCKPCVASIPEQKAFFEDFGDQVNILGLAYDNKANAEKLVNDKQIPWANGMITKEIVKSLMVEGYPYYVLLNENAQVLKLGTHRIEDIHNIIKARIK